jgi:hypothetical protein
MAMRFPFALPFASGNRRNEALLQRRKKIRSIFRIELTFG